MARQNIETTDTLEQGRVKINANDTEEYTDIATAIAAAASAQNTANAAQPSAGKDATGGYAGLTLFKINFKNVLDTFISFFTNANTAARTYTYQDRDGTIADLIDVQVVSEVIVTTTANLDATAYAKIHICKGTSANYTVTLPAGAAGDVGKMICIKGDSDIAVLNKQVTVDGSGTEKVDNYLNKIITTSGFITVRLRVTTGVYHWDVINFDQGAYIDYTSTITFVGISGVTSGYSYRVVNKTLHLNIYPGQVSVGAGTTFTFTLPQGFQASLNGICAIARTINNAATAVFGGSLVFVAGSNVVQGYIGIVTAWSGTGDREIVGTFVIPIH